MSAIRPLPPRPSLEFEHKEAKALVRLLRAGDAEALTRARAQHPALDTSSPANIPLADAQLVIAREYGFASWPRLVRYFEDVERQRFTQKQLHSDEPKFYEDSARRLMEGHRQRGVRSGRTLGAYVPRFYGLQADAIFASSLTEDEARLATARQYGLPSWEVLLQRIKTVEWLRPSSLAPNPRQEAIKAIGAANLEELQRLAREHPEMLVQSDDDYAIGRSLLGTALAHEKRLGREALAPIVEWLVSQGFDVQRELNRQLCRRFPTRPEDIPWLLDRGADPDALAPNGITILEHAIAGHWNGDVVDLIAARAHPRQALWICAGLGDVDGVARFLDAQGKPTEAARRDRPYLDAIGFGGMLPPLPDASDEAILWETFFIAVLNSRTAVIEYLVSRGFPVDNMYWGSPMIAFAAGNGFTKVVECLVKLGANVDLHGWGDMTTARDISREMLEQAPDNEDRRRIAELCGLDPDAVIRERDARPVPPPEIHPMVREALELAGDDAARLGQDDIHPVNLLVGVLRCGSDLPQDFVRMSGVDMVRFRADFSARVRPKDERLQRTALPLHPDAQAMVQDASSVMTERRRGLVNVYSLMYALTRQGHGAVPNLVTRYGGSVVSLNTELERRL